MLRVSMQVKASPGTDKNFCAKPKPRHGKGPPSSTPRAAKTKHRGRPQNLSLPAVVGRWRRRRKLSSFTQAATLFPRLFLAFGGGEGGGCPKTMCAEEVCPGRLKCILPSRQTCCAAHGVEVAFTWTFFCFFCMPSLPGKGR